MRRDLFNEKQWECVVPFGSQKHKLLYCLADFVITAFIEKNNYLPFTDQEYQNVQDVATIPQIIYLQHGVFHAHIPWKYSVDRMQVDKMVVTAKFEKKNMLALYGFKKHQCFKYLDCDGKKRESCLRRQDHVHTADRKRGRIECHSILAPSPLRQDLPGRHARLLLRQKPFWQIRRELRGHMDPFAQNSQSQFILLPAL